MILPPAPKDYSRSNEQQTRNQISAADAANLKLGLIEDGYLVANEQGRPAFPTGHSLTDYLDYVLFTLQDVPETVPASPAVDQWEGSIIYRDTTENGGWLGLKPGLIHQILETQGPGEIPQWIDLTTLMDAVFGSSQGDILYRASDKWKALSPGTAGYVLTTEGPGANPVWGAGASIAFANPTATAGPNAVNGVATTVMRSDSAPKVQTATAAQLGLVQPDGTVITVTAGAITVPKCTTSSMGVCQPDGTSVIVTSGVISSVGIADGSIDAMFFGNGHDGNLSISSGITTLARDTFYLNLTISGTAVLKTAGNRLYVSGILDISNAPAGAIQNIAPQGQATQRTAANAGAAANTVGQGVLGTDGGTASTTVGSAGGAVTTGSGFTNIMVSGVGGTGGQGSSSSNHGGAGGTVLGTSTINADIRTLTQSHFIYCSNLHGGILNPGTGGSGGGAGGGDGTNLGGVAGGAGAGGCTLYVAARTIARGTNTTASIFQALGGAGQNGTNAGSTGNIGGGGGGGGGAGGWIYLIYRTRTGTPITGCLDATGGAGGSGGNGHGTGLGGDSGAPGGGGRIDVYDLGAGTQTITEAVAAGSRNSASGGTGGGAKAATAQQVNL